MLPNSSQREAQSQRQAQNLSLTLSLTLPSSFYLFYVFVFHYACISYPSVSLTLGHSFHFLSIYVIILSSPPPCIPQRQAHAEPHAGPSIFVYLFIYLFCLLPLTILHHTQRQAHAWASRCEPHAGPLISFSIYFVLSYSLTTPESHAVSYHVHLHTCIPFLIYCIKLSPSPHVTHVDIYYIYFIIS